MKKIKQLKKPKGLSFFLLSLLVFWPCPAGVFASETTLLSGLTDARFKPDTGPEAKRLFDVLGEGLSSYEKLRDYRAKFIKKERSGSELAEEEEIFLKFEKPFKIFMKWLNTGKRGVEVFYERGRNNGKLVIHQPGLLLGLAPVIFLDQNSPWVREGSASYNIEDAGIGTFLADFTKAVISAGNEKKLKVEWPKERVSDVTFLESKKDTIYFAYRVRVLFDEKTSLPIRMELFDWHDTPMGIYEYRDLALNVGEDTEFKKEINRHLLKVYRSGEKTKAASSANLA